jgi:hypothetical protein
MGDVTTPDTASADRPAMRTLALLTTIGFFGALALLWIVGKPKEGADAFMMLIGSLGTVWTGVMATYFKGIASK